jgi:hypothetical protein
VLRDPLRKARIGDAAEVEPEFAGFGLQRGFEIRL